MFIALCKRSILILAWLVLLAPYLGCGEIQKDLSIRTPRAVLIDLLSHLENAKEKSPGGNNGQENFDEEIADIKSRIMTHDLKIESVRNYLKTIKNKPDLADSNKKINDLLKQLMDEPDYVRLWKAFYGRVFDSALVYYLVKYPPSAVADAMTKMGQGLGELLEREIEPNKQILPKLENKIYTLLTKEDPRFWFPKVAVLTEIRKKGQKNSVRKLISYLGKRKETGEEIISVSYLITKISLALREVGYDPKYLKKATKTYKVLHQMVKGIILNMRPPKGVLPSRIILTKSGGITRPNQPPVIKEDWMMESQKWGDIRSPRFKPQKTKKNNALLQARKALFNQLEHNVVWVSGMSGSTNIDLHAWDWLHNNEKEYIQKNIDKRAAFLGIIMFLVYDGGHSIFEPLWAAFEIEKLGSLNLGFDLADKSTKVEEFIPNFERFVKIFQNTELFDPLNRAVETAFDTTILYFRKYSFFRDPKWQAKYPDKKNIQEKPIITN